MKRKNLLTLLGLILFAGSISAQLPLIPMPAKVEQHDGVFVQDAVTQIWFTDASLHNYAQKAAVELGINPSNVRAANTEKMQQAIVFSLLQPADQQLGVEGYKLQIDTEKVLLQANGSAGIGYGLQTLVQLKDAGTNGQLPALEIIDQPRFAYRGMHLDVSRHFQPLSLIYKLLDQLEKHKMNVFHWHLVDDQGWRIEIKKYPKLTEVGAWRADISDRHWNDRPVSTDLKPTYGGYYTQEEIKSVVAYAAERNITVIPEIEMPAHVMSALAAYPELSCTGENLGVPPGGVWPITHIYCAGNDASFVFLEDVLKEVMELFPSVFIHIGGDEADKTEWEKCPKCQERIKNEGLVDEHGLQSYFIKRIEHFLNEHGRRLIGWDEILEGGLAPNATVMSWRGEEGGIVAARMGHDVVMTPGTHCYFDHYQGNPAVEPLAIGGYTTLKKVYGYEPVPAALETDFHHHVLGAQANVWTEYMPVPEHVEYMVFPRLAALAEVLWSPKNSRDWQGFSKRMEKQYVRYERDQLNYAKSAFQLVINALPDPDTRTLELTLASEVFEPEIRYTTNGKNPDQNSTLYQKPFRISESSTVKAAVFGNGKMKGAVIKQNFLLHKAFGYETTLKYSNSNRFDAHGQYGLVDGVLGSANHDDGLWKGFLGDDMVAAIDLGEVKQIQRIAIHVLQHTGSWIFYPTRLVVEASDDGKQFTQLAEVANTVSPLQSGRMINEMEIQLSQTNTRYLRITAVNQSICPVGHAGEGKKAWMFVSEIIVE